MFLPANITLQLGDSGDFVSELQRRLAAVKAHAEHGINGVFDGMTVNSVSAFQSRVGIRADGIAGPETLRRLNGVISGDASGWGDNNHTAEEDAKIAAAKQQEALLREQEMARIQQEQLAAEAASAAAAVAARAEPVLQEQYTPSTPAPMADAHAYQQPHPPQQAQSSAPAMPLNMGDMLAQMLQQQVTQHQTPHVPQPEPIAQVAATPTPQQAQTPHHTQPVTPAPVPLSAGELLVQQLQQQTQTLAQQPAAGRAEAVAKQPPVPHAAAPVAHAQAAPKPPVDVAQALATAPVQEESAGRSLIGRAMQKMDAVIQRLSQHFETKLPPDVMREVERIGQIMAQSGVREVAVPGGPEPARSATPARGPEQQPAQRG